MDMGDSSMEYRPSCKISMLWNWTTIDACFISRDWHIRSKVAFAFSVICVFILVALVEGVRRLQREYDRRLIREAQSQDLSPPLPELSGKSSPSETPVLTAKNFVPTWKQQAIRSAIFGVQFGAAYILMLLAMYYNGFIIFAIILGGTAGHFVFGRDTVAFKQGEKGAHCCGV